MVTGRDFPRPWLERRHTSAPRLVVLVVLAAVIVFAVLALGSSTSEYVPSPTVTVGTAGEATPFEVDP